MLKNRNIKISVRLSETEHMQLKTKAEKAGLKNEPFIRSLISNIKLQEKPSEEYKLLLRELSAIGNNINQIARVANSCGSVEKAQLVAMRSRIDELWEKVRYG